MVGGVADDRVGCHAPCFADAELWDPLTGTFGPTGSLTDPRTRHTATLLPDGHVLIVGGAGTGRRWADTHGLITEAELWDPATGAHLHTQ